MKISLKYDKSFNKTWFSVKTDSGGTCKNPYGYLTVKELKAMKNAINKALREHKGGKDEKRK